MKLINEIAKIELLEAPSRSDREPLAMTSNNSISAAKLLENVEKSYDKGKLIPKESENTIWAKPQEYTKTYTKVWLFGKICLSLHPEVIFRVMAALAAKIEQARQ